MATRTERADDAIDLVDGDVGLLWALALNDRPVGRDYLLRVTGIERRRLVRALARLANAGILAETDGLVFALDRDASRAELRERAPAGELREIHELGLAWAEETGLADEVFVATHRVGAARHEEAAPHLVRMIEDAGAAVDPRVPALAKAALLGLLDHARENRDVILELGVLLLERGGAVLKPMEFRNVVTTLKELEPDEEQALRIAAAEEAARAEARARRARKAAAADPAPDGERSG